MTLLNFLIKKRIPISAPCGGRGRCGQCLVKIKKPRKPDEIESVLIPEHLLKRGYRLACRRRANEHFILVRSRLKKNKAVDAKVTGLALDLGTTTIKGAVVNLRNGRVLREEAIFNPQNSLGGDVITRIGLALEGKYKLLRNLLLSGIKDISTTLGIRKPQFTVVVGNPVMLSFYLDKPVEGFASYPFKSELKDGMFLKHPARYVFPIIGGFVGGDTIAGLLACGFLRKSGTTLYIDLGTNGEVVLAWPGSVMAVSTAAGPAFEGAGIKAGSLAVPGAIDRVYYKGGIKYHTIGNKKPIGLCASGLIDLLAVMLKQGWLEPSGQLLKTVEIDGISINQEDIRKLQLAIGAIHVGIETLLLKASTMPARIDEAIITGEFGAHLNPASLVAVGLIPTGIKKIRLERDLPLRGAVRFLQDDRARAEVKQIQKISGHLELALEPYFGERFIWSLRLAPWK